MNEISTQDGTLGRSLRVRAYGDTTDEIELYALDEARKVFGGDVQLTVRRDYMIVATTESVGAIRDAAAGKRYTASVDVREQ